jgi:hypothetical protein
VQAATPTPVPTKSCREFKMNRAYKQPDGRTRPQHYSCNVRTVRLTCPQKFENHRAKKKAETAVLQYTDNWFRNVRFCFLGDCVCVIARVCVCVQKHLKNWVAYQLQLPEKIIRQVNTLYRYLKDEVKIGNISFTQDVETKD